MQIKTSAVDCIFFYYKSDDRSLNLSNGAFKSVYTAERVLSYFPFTAHLLIYIRQNKVQVIVVLDFYIHTVVIVIIIQYYIKQLTSVCNQYRTMRHAINSSSWLRLSSYYGILLHTLFSMFIFFLIIWNLKKLSDQNMIPELLK